MMSFLTPESVNLPVRKKNSAVLGFSLGVMDNHGSISSNTAVVYVMIKHTIPSVPPLSSNSINQQQQQQHQHPIPAPHVSFAPNQPLPQFHAFR
jgi:hypothetical protein